MILKEKLLNILKLMKMKIYLKFNIIVKIVFIRKCEVRVYIEIDFKLM